MDVDASAMINFMSTLGAGLIVLQPAAGLAGDSLPLGTREGGPGAETGGAGVGAGAGAGAGLDVSGSSMMNTSSSGMPAAAVRALNVGRSIGLSGADCLLARLPGPGGDSLGESLNAPGRKDGTICWGMSCSASQSPHVSMALSTSRVERESGYLAFCAARTNVESCLMRSAGKSSSMRLSRKTSMLIAMYSCTSRTSALAW